MAASAPTPNSHPAGSTLGADRRAAVLATVAAAAIFVALIWVYSAVRLTATCHSAQGHIKVGRSLNGLVCSYHDGVTRVSGF